MDKKNSSPINATDKKNRNSLCTVIFFAIAILSIWAVSSQSSAFSVYNFWEYIKNSSPLWIACAFMCMILFILFEGLALMVICRMFGHKATVLDGYIYSASDIYFSAITPSATGGQPASAYFMIKKGMPAMTVAAALLLNLCMYTVSIIVIGLFCFILKFDLFVQYSTTSKLFIAIGSAIQVFLAVGLILLLVNDKLLYRISKAIISFLCKIRILRHKESKLEKLNQQIKTYRECATIIYNRNGKLWIVFVLNFLQRVAQIAVTVFTYMATSGKSFLESIDLFFLQGYAVLGANCMPIPGGIGISDYIMLDGFGNVMDESQAVYLELLSRSLSFYICVGICGISFVISYFVIKGKANKK